MGLGLKADIECHAGDRMLGVQQQFLRACDAASENVVMRAKAGSGTELRREVHTRQASGIREITKRNRTFETGINVLEHSLEPPPREFSSGSGAASRVQMRRDQAGG
jgi:hypothetical protein